MPYLAEGAFADCAMQRKVIEVDFAVEVYGGGAAAHSAVLIA